MNKRLFLVALGLAAALPASGAFAQPSGKPVRIVVSLLAGSAIDFQARLLAPHLSASLGQPVIVENKAGGKDIIAMMDVIKSAPDGNTLYMGSQSPLAINVPMVKNLPYDPRKDVTPISGVSLVNHVLIVKIDFPAKTVAEFIAYAKKNPGKVSIGYSTTTVQAEIAAMNKLAGIEVLPVPYKGVPATVTDLLGGTLSATFVDPGQCASAHQKWSRARARRDLAEAQSADARLACDCRNTSGLRLSDVDRHGRTAGDVAGNGEQDPRRDGQRAQAKERRGQTSGSRNPSVFIKPEDLKALIDADTAKWIKIAKDENLQAE